MSRQLYGGTAADVTTSHTGRVIPGTVGTAWFSRDGEDRAYDLTTLMGVPSDTVTSDAAALLLFYGPDGYAGPLWVDFGLGYRTVVKPVQAADPDAGFLARVTNTGAVGDGVTDDTAAIEAAILAAGEGGVVYFPPGAYRVSRTLWPEHGQTWTGTHSPKYRHDDDPDSSCVIVAAPEFTGRALVERGAGINGVTIERLCLLGQGDEATPELHGLHISDLSWEKSWKVQECTIHGFSGAGITGRLHVFDVRDCHVARNGYGLRVTGDNSLTDVRIYGSQFYFNLHGGLCLDSETRSNGMVSIHGCRFERSGSTPGNPGVNRDPDAPGIRIQRALNCDLVQCSTDANSGEGLVILGDPGAGIYTYGITISDCKFARDGGGDQTLGVQKSGIKLKGVSSIYIQSNVTWGEADDDGDGSGLISPYYCLWLEDAVACKVSNSWMVAPNPLNSVHRVGNTTGTVVDGAASYIDLLGTDLQNKEVRYRLDDGVGGTVTRWVNGVNPTGSGGSWSVQRYDAAGAYVDSPININWATGLVETNRLYVRAQTASQIPLEVRSFDTSPTVSYFKVADSTGSAKFEVRYDGTVRAAWGSSSYRRVQLGSTQIVRESAVGAYSILACYTSVANADAGTPVFEVRPNGVQIPAATNSTDAVQKAQIKTIVAASTDFADFKTRMAAW